MKTKHLSTILLAYLFAGFLFTACKKENANSDVETSLPPERKVSRALSADEDKLKNKLKHVSYLLAEALKDKSFHKELNMEIAAKLKATNNDEALSFKEILGSQGGSSGSYRINRSFADKFLQKLNAVKASGLYPGAIQSDKKSPGNTISTWEPIIQDPPDGEVYFPYSENFNLDPSLTNYTITSHPIDNSDENEGIVWNPSTGNWDYVLVDDTYAYTHPTYIITVDDGPTPESVADSPYTWEFPEIMAPPPTFPTNSSGIVHFGKLHLEKQSEGLFDGASEITLIRPLASPKLDANGELNTVDFVIGQMVALPKIKRKKIRLMAETPAENVHVGASFTTNWKSAYQEMPMVIYEYDKGTNFSFEIPSITYKKGDNSISAGGKFAINIPSKKSPYIADLIDRDAYFYYKNISNPMHNPGQYDTWRTWGMQAANVSLVYEGAWQLSYSF